MMISIVNVVYDSFMIVISTTIVLVVITNTAVATTICYSTLQ